MFDEQLEILLKNEEFSELYAEHIRLEQDLEALYSLKYRPPSVEAEIKELKIIKLRGKDRMQQIAANLKN
jgi:uncharacterized protein YdcH (DUF465 family)